MNRRSLGCLILFHAAFFFHAYTSTDTFFLRDFSIVQYPVKKLALESLRQGEMPLWIESLSGGQPLAANPNYFLFHPLNLLPLLLGEAAGLKFVLCFAYLIASIGAYQLARAARLGESAALLAAFGFAYSGFLISLSNLLNSLLVASLLPWLLLAVRRLDTDRAPLRFLAVTMIAAVQIFGGEPVPAILSFAAAAAYAATRGFRFLLKTLSALLLGILVAAPQVIPAVVFLLHSNRAAGIGSASSLKWSTPAIRLLELIFPKLLGSTAFCLPPGYLGGAFEDDGFPYIANVAVGPVLLLLALYGCRFCRLARLLTAIGAGLAILSLGRALPGAESLVTSVPILSILRYPSKIHLLVTLSMTLAAAFGLDAVMQGKPMFGGGLFALGAALPVTLLVSPIARLVARRSANGADAVEARLTLHGFIIVGFLVASSLLMLAAARLLVSRKTAVLGLLGFELLFLLLFMPGIAPMVSRRFYDEVPPPVKVILEQPDPRSGRIFFEHPGDGLMLPGTEGSSLESAIGQRRLGMEFVGRIYGLDYAFEDGWEGITLKAIEDDLHRFRDLSWQGKLLKLDAASVRYVLSFEDHPDLPEVARFRGLERRTLHLYRNPGALPFVTPALRARLVSRQPTRWEIALTGKPGPIRVSVNGYPGWRAYADGAPCPITSPVDAPFIALAPPSGTHRVTLVLTTKYVAFGFYLSALGMLFALVPAIRERKRAAGR